MRTDGADRDLLRWVVEQESAHGELPVQTLLIVTALRDRGQMRLDELAADLHRDPDSTRRLLARLQHAGILEATGKTRGRRFALTASVFRGIGDASGYVRHRGIEEVRYPELVRRFAESNGEFRRADVMKLLDIEGRVATRLLGRLVTGGVLVKHGVKRGSSYTLAESE